jgi:hypothetical protein
MAVTELNALHSAKEIGRVIRSRTNKNREIIVHNTDFLKFRLKRIDKHEAFFIMWQKYEANSYSVKIVHKMSLNISMTTTLFSFKHRFRSRMSSHHQFSLENLSSKASSVRSRSSVCQFSVAELLWNM